MKRVLFFLTIAAVLSAAALLVVHCTNPSRKARPWVIYGEGPTAESDNPIRAQGFNEGRQKYSAADIRFNKKGDKVLYVTLMGVPEGDVTVKALGSKTAQNSRKIKSISLLGSDEKIAWTQGKDALTIVKPSETPSPEAIVFIITLR